MTQEGRDVTEPSLGDDFGDDAENTDATPTDPAAIEHESASEKQNTLQRTRRLRGPSRNTLAREQRRRRSSARKARRRWIYGVAGGVVAAALIAGLVLPSFGNLGGPTSGPDSDANLPNVGTRFPIQDGSIIAMDAEHMPYAHIPPTSGPRYVNGVIWGMHKSQQPEEAILRNLEQGGIAAHHNLADQAQLDDLESYLKGQSGYPGCFVVQPHDSVTEGNVTLAAWGWSKSFVGVDRPGMEEFILDHRNSGPLFIDNGCGPPLAPRNEANKPASASQ